MPKDSPIKSVADLKGKKVALNKGSNVHYLLVQGAREGRAEAYADIQPVYLPPADARAAFESGTVDAWVIWDPFLAAAEKQIGARVLADGTGPGRQPPVLPGRRAAIAEKHPQVIQAVVRGLAREGQLGQGQPAARSPTLIAPQIGLPVDDRRSQPAPLRLRHPADLDAAVIAEQQKIADTFHELKLIPRRSASREALRGKPRREAAPWTTLTSSSTASRRPRRCCQPPRLAGAPGACARRRKHGRTLRRRSAQLRIGYQKAAVNLVILKQQGALEKRFPATPGAMDRVPRRPAAARGAGRSAASSSASTGDSPPVFAQAAGKDLLYVGAEPPKPRQLGDPGAERLAAQDAGRPEGQARSRCRRARARTTCWCARWRRPACSGATSSRSTWRRPTRAPHSSAGRGRLGDLGPVLRGRPSWRQAARAGHRPRPVEQQLVLPGLAALRHAAPERRAVLFEELTRADRLRAGEPQGSVKLIADFSGLSLATVHLFLQRRPPSPVGRSRRDSSPTSSAWPMPSIKLGLDSEAGAASPTSSGRPQRGRQARSESRPMKIFWFIPTHGDSRYLGTAEGRARRQPRLPQAGRARGRQPRLRRRAAADRPLVRRPVGRRRQPDRRDAATSSSWSRCARACAAGQSARMAATFDRLSGGRLLVNLVTGGDQAELEGDGVFLAHAARYEQSAEFITHLARDCWRAATQAAVRLRRQAPAASRARRLLYPPLQTPHPPVFFGGSSEAAHELAAEQVDTYLTWGEPPAAVAGRWPTCARARHATAARSSSASACT